MKKIFLILVVVLVSCTINAQSKPATAKKSADESKYTALRPSDAQPAVFNSKSELDAKIADKKNNIINLIKSNENDPVKVKYYREELWRFENAIVKEPGK